jgi:hypothetical protein
MAQLKQGTAYFGTIFVPAGVKMPKPSELSSLFPNWRWPTKQDVQTGRITWYELAGKQGPLWWFGKTCQAACPGESGDCRVPWPDVDPGPGCGPLPPGNSNSTWYNRYIPGTITGESRDLTYLPQDKQDYLNQYYPPPAPGDPGAYKDLTPYDRTFWFTSEWLGPTGENALTYVDPASGGTCFVYDLWDQNGVQVASGSAGDSADPADAGWKPPRFSQADPSKPDFQRVNQRPSFSAAAPEKAKVSPNTGVILIMSALVIAAGGVWYFNRKDAEAELAANPTHNGRFLLDGEPIDIIEFLQDNAEGLHPEEVQEIGSLDVGDTFQGGGGAWATFVIERVG